MKYFGKINIGDGEMSKLFTLAQLSSVEFLHWTLPSICYGTTSKHQRITWPGLYRTLIECQSIVVLQMRVCTCLLEVTWLECANYYQTPLLAPLIHSSLLINQEIYMAWREHKYEQRSQKNTACGWPNIFLYLLVEWLVFLLRLYSYVFCCRGIHRKWNHHLNVLWNSTLITFDSPVQTTSKCTSQFNTSPNLLKYHSPL